MDKIKIQNFLREYPNKPFPNFKLLSNDEAKEKEEIFRERLRLPIETTPLELVQIIQEMGVSIPNIDAELDGFNLKSLMDDITILPEKYVFINWYRFDVIDEIGLDDLSEFFDDIWYPAVDHIDIFDQSHLWIISIDYSGNVSTLKFV